MAEPGQRVVAKRPPPVTVEFIDSSNNTFATKKFRLQDGRLPMAPLRAEFKTDMVFADDGAEVYGEDATFKTFTDGEVVRIKGVRADCTGTGTSGAAGGRYIPGAPWDTSKLMSLWKSAGRLHHAMPTWVAEEVKDMGERFSHYWNANRSTLQDLKLTTKLCGPEPDEDCYAAAHTILSQIYRRIAAMSMNVEGGFDRGLEQDVDRTIFKAINQMNLLEHGSGAADMAWGVLDSKMVSDRGRAGLEWKDHGMIIQEFMAQEQDLNKGIVQVVDRADAIRQARQARSDWPRGQQSILVGAASTGAALHSLLVVHNPDGSLHALYQSELLELAVGSPLGTRDMDVDTNSAAFKELVWHVWYSVSHMLSTQAEPSDELLPGDIVRVAVVQSGGVEAGSGCNSCICDSFRISRRLSHHVSRTGAAYAATALGASGAGGPAVVIKIGPSPADRKLALHLGLSWPPWFQVDRELAARLGSSGCRNMPPLIAGGTVERCQRGEEVVAPRLRGAAFVATQLMGEALVKDGVLPVLSAQEVLVLLECLTLAVLDLQAQGIHHNDINLRNIGVQHCSDGTPQAFYLYDLGAAAAESVTQMLQRVSFDIGLEALLSRNKSLVWDLEFGSYAAISGAPLQPHSDLESLLFCCIRLLGQELPWSEAAAAGNSEEVIRLRKAAATEPSSLPGFASYPALLQDFAVTLLSWGRPGSANSEGAPHITAMQSVMQQLVRAQ